MKRDTQELELEQALPGAGVGGHWHLNGRFSVA